MNNMGNRVGANAGAQNANRGNMRPYAVRERHVCGSESAGVPRDRRAGWISSVHAAWQPLTAPSMGSSPRGTMQMLRGKPRRLSSVYAAERQQSSVNHGSSAPATGHVPICASEQSGRIPSVHAAEQSVLRSPNMGTAPQRGTYQSAPAENRGSYRPPILLRGARWAAVRTRTGEAAAITGIAPRRATVRRSSGGIAVLRTRVVDMGVAHLRVHSWICASRLYAPRHTAEVAIRGPATRVAADTVRRLPATAVRIARQAAVAPRPMGAAVVDIMAAEWRRRRTLQRRAVADTPAAEVVVTRAVAAVTPVEAIAKSS